jgi:hypothetical protein
MLESVQTSKDYSSRVAENRACPGVLMLNVSMRVLWADRRAWNLLPAVDDRAKGKSQSTHVPTVIKEIGEKAFALLRQGRVKKTDSPSSVRLSMERADLFLYAASACRTPKNRDSHDCSCCWSGSGGARKLRLSKPRRSSGLRNAKFKSYSIC